jgi:hypothetical protein
MQTEKVIFKKVLNYSRLNCTATIQIELRERFNIYEKKKYIEFSASGNIFHPDKCIHISGQCIDEIAKYIKNAKIKRICEVWKSYHLNGFHAGCKHLRHLEKDKPFDHIGEVCPVCGYKFGSEWRVEEIPVEIIEEIKTW